MDFYVDQTNRTDAAVEVCDMPDHHRAYLQCQTEGGVAATAALGLAGNWAAVLSSTQRLSEKTAS